uniref:Uncharacterized protein n=1 Tax=Arundo donax TaxID=35708 RepID=A0A0A9B9W8_ARUDO
MRKIYLYILNLSQFPILLFYRSILLNYI